jgi:hypothetical protein
MEKTKRQGSYRRAVQFAETKARCMAEVYGQGESDRIEVVVVIDLKTITAKKRISLFFSFYSFTSFVSFELKIKNEKYCLFFMILTFPDPSFKYERFCSSFLAHLVLYVQMKAFLRQSTFDIGVVF